MKPTATTALLPIDMQQAFDHAPWPRRGNPAMDRNGQRLLAAWRAAGAPIIHVKHSSLKEEGTLHVSKPGNRLRPGFEPLPGEPLVEKQVNSAFIGTDLDLRLRRLGVDTVVTFGISADMCVSTTVRHGSNLGYRMVLVADASAAFDLPDRAGAVIPAEEVARVHLATLAYEFAMVVDTAELVEA